jgi:hypothetical protein
MSNMAGFAIAAWQAFWPLGLLMTMTMVTMQIAPVRLD